MRIIVDTNVLISAIIFSGETPRACLRHVLGHHEIIFSNETFAEFKKILLSDKFYRDKFLRYTYVKTIENRGKFVETFHTFKDCRDAKDNMILEAAVSGKADYIITGDKDLLVLSPFRGITILSPGEFLLRVGL